MNDKVKCSGDRIRWERESRRKIKESDIDWGGGDR